MAIRRRELLGSIAPGSALALMGASAASAAEPPSAGASTWPTEEASLRVGAVDLSQLDVIDVHVHQPSAITYSEGNKIWIADFVNSMMPREAAPGDDELRAQLTVEFNDHFNGMPRETGMKNYVARVYGVEPTSESLDAIMTKHLGDFTSYFRTVMDREKVVAVALQSTDIEPVRPKSLVPDDRFVWTYSIAPLIQPDWAKEQGISHIDEYLAAIYAILEKCAANGCRGIKIPVAYYRPLKFDKVSRADAEKARKKVFAAKNEGYLRHKAPYFSDPEITKALWKYQDYLFRNMFAKIGKLGMRVVIHSAVGLHPALRSDYNSPLELYHTFQDPDIRRAGTKFIIIHSGYPHHHHVAGFLSQFPNVYTDLSFYANHPGTLEDILRTFLGLAPSEKILHGSDWSVPETLGYCAYNVRHVMAKILRDYRADYGWTDKDCEKMARNVLADNARRFYNIEL